MKFKLEVGIKITIINIFATKVHFSACVHGRFDGGGRRREEKLFLRVGKQLFENAINNSNVLFCYKFCSKEEEKKVGVGFKRLVVSSRWLRNSLELMSLINKIDAQALVEGVTYGCVVGHGTTNTHFQLHSFVATGTLIYIKI